MKLEEGAGENFISLKAMMDLWTYKNMTRIDTKKEALSSSNDAATAV
eukprot:CAMPEP_0202391278 /NCGR_PEP_ID=MMETSP1127-20130417/91753_1 /ASSEMBLY_ACC=CAM_ASM_000462 /TAXON_ID=3047 /ORGANISM="Dunaliella tertiolecta, Strain CCMP1320" /LENGTH=46 /DNA_ID= /DNA_START= /DNA_END= /DNA_ORIENTATION=